MTDGSRRLTTSDLAAAEALDAMARAERAREQKLRRDAPPAATNEPNESNAPLLVHEDADAFRTRWSSIQAGFVDEPSHAIEEADALAAEVIQRLAEGFATEDPRLAMRRYRSFFDRVLAE